MLGTISDYMLSRRAWQITLAMVCLTIVSAQIVGLEFRGRLTPELKTLIAGLICLAVFYRFVRRDQGIVRMVISMGQLVVVMIMGLMLTYVASTVPLPYRDFELHAVDRWIGFERSAYLEFLARNDWLRAILGFSYDTLLPQGILVLFVLPAVRRVDRLQRYVIAFAIAVTATAAIAIFVPAANAAIYLDRLPTDLSGSGLGYFPTLQGLRSGTIRSVSFDAMEGLISFPSFHTANAILIVWTLWPIVPLRFLLLPLNALLIASTPLCGAHYVTDIAGGAAVAFAAILVASRLGRAPREREQELPAAGEPTAVPSL
jgi:membrane-associated phospholipid phosphatase